jgi:hypothetical protein
VELDIELQFTVCDKAASEPCPLWTGRPITSDWWLEDPATTKVLLTDNATLSRMC